MSEEKSLSLFNITQKLVEVENEIAASGGELTEKNEELIEKLSVELTHKTDGVVHWINLNESKIQACKDEIARIKNIQSSTEKNLNNFKNYIVSSMDYLETIELAGKINTIKIRKPSEIVEIENENDIPLEFIKTAVIKKVSVDKTGIKKALKNGETVTGAKLIKGKRNLIIK